MFGSGPSISQGHRGRLALLTVVAAVAFPAVAFGHLERPSYWPDPTPDTAISPAAGGKVPKARSLASAVTGRGPGDVRVVCEPASLKRALKAIDKAERRGYRLRPSQPKIKVSSAQAKKLSSWNRRFYRQCNFRTIQKAINRSGNNDRIVVMPGRYTEPKSRRAPTNDPKCNPSLVQENQSGADTPSYAYQATCPNDQNLIYIQGRAVKGDPLSAPDPNRHGIPSQELGRCVRCNLQIEGSGIKPEDVIMDAAKGYRNANNPGAKPGVKFESCKAVDGVSPCYAKHVVMRTDRSDGFVGRNFLLRGALEHGFYTEETDGILLDRVKFYWAADYGHLSFTTDHNVIKNCEGFGSGDAVVYPGASPQTGEYRDESFYPKERLNTVVKDCDLHGSTLAYSGSMGNSVRMTRNNIYGNTNGISSDTLSASGHPGFPADGMKIDHNLIYSNNLNLYTENPPIDPYVPMPIGTGLVWPGMNDGIVTKNWIFDNWRHGTLLAAVPDEVAGTPEGNVDADVHCANPDVTSTSCGNNHFGNRMGQVPPGFKPHPQLRRFGNRTGLDTGGISELPNGVDFWWDEFATNTANCWFDNTGPDGTTGSITGPGVGQPPDLLPDCAGGTNPALSVGNGDVIKEAQLLDCSMWSRGETSEDHPLCYWFTMPAQPNTRAANRQNRQIQAAGDEFIASEEGRRLAERLEALAQAAR